MRKIFALLIITLVVFCSISKYGIKPPRPVYKSPDAYILDASKGFPIVRMLTFPTLHSQCSAVIVSDKLAITAAHCGEIGDLFIITDKNGNHKTESIIISRNERMDLAAIVGDFREYNKVYMAVNTEEVLNIINNGDLVGCGYPMGGKLYCTELLYPQRLNLGFLAKGYYVPGMSGGPVIDQKTGALVGINVSVDGEYAFFTPTIEIIYALGVSEIQ